MINQEIKLSKEFKSQTAKAILSILFFVISYFIILLFVLALTASCIYGGIMLIVSFPRFITLALGIGLASLGVLVLIFIIKFIFKSQKQDLSHLIEIKATEEPALFKMIEEIVQEVGTNFPKKVFLSSDVNAAVFYNSNFWSMILPVRKNLQIGLALINTVTKSELKAILSHEFGHFSQKTMKVGSYVYNVNMVIFNMLYDNDSYDSIVQKWANTSQYFAIFAVGAIKIVKAIQWVLRKLYELVNKSYMGLSREMEFHADEIAANVTGYEPLRSSLLRMNLSAYSFNNLLNYYSEKSRENIKSSNLYPEHLYIMDYLAQKSEVTLSNGLPQVSIEDLNKFNHSRLVIKDQWASHPSEEERIQHLENTGLNAVQLESDHARILFKDFEAREKQMTEFLFKAVSFENDPSTQSYEDFIASFKEEIKKHSFPEVYNGYYDSKNPEHFDLNQTKSAANNNVIFQELFGDKMVNLVLQKNGLESDLETLSQIVANNIKVKSFDFDGKKYKRKEVHQLIPKLKNELTNLKEEVEANDVRIYQFFRSFEQLSDHESQLKHLYEELFRFDSEFDSRNELITTIYQKLEFINYNMPYDEIKSNFNSIVAHEARLKDEIVKLKNDGRFDSIITEDIKANFESYISNDWSYFNTESYNEKGLEVLFTAINNYAQTLSKAFIIIKKNVLDYQAYLLESSKVNVGFRVF